MVVVVVSGGGDGERYGELKCGECLCGERSGTFTRAKRPPRAVDGRERRSEAAPTTALAASSRGDALRVPVSAGAVHRHVYASGDGNFRVAPLRLPVSVIRGYCRRS